MMGRVRRKRHRERQLVAIVEAEYQLRRERRAVVLKHARPAGPWGGAMQCTPTRAELAGELPRKNHAGNDGKVIFDSRDAAEACAREMAALGAVQMRSYHCGRHRPGHDGHWHLTTDGPAARARRARAAAEFEQLLGRVTRYAS